MTQRVPADASATKTFFVDMLIRDIGVDGAILDLIDNSIDAASIQAALDGTLEGYRIEVAVGQDEFKIHDNCGGIEVDTARNYAFRFGRAPDFNPASRIGEFGIGMKRAVFRLGRRFTIDSSTDKTRFVVDVDVQEWRGQDGDWTFPMDIEDAPSEEAGTTVVVRNLHDGVRDLFSQSNYVPGILREVTDRYGEAMRQGLQITFNKEPADLRLHTLLSGPQIKAEHQEHELLVDGHPVKLRIVAGIGPDRLPVESGWYVYCNGRLVIKADRTELTGWSIGDVDGVSGTPAWHPQYGRFRGFVFFNSDYPGSLPWTTTKTEIDEFSPIYRNAVVKMRSIIRNYANYTNELVLERRRYEESDSGTPRRIEEALKSTVHRTVDQVPPGKFTIPERDNTPPPPAGPRTTSIQINVKVSQIDELKEALDLSTNRQVGEMAFKRLYDEEID